MKFLLQGVDQKHKQEASFSFGGGLGHGSDSPSLGGPQDGFACIARCLAGGRELRGQMDVWPSYFFMEL